MGLKTRDSDTVSQPGENLSLRLLEQLIGPLKIEVMTYTVREVSVGPDGAKVHYAMQLRVSDPRSGKTVINVSGAQRVLEWTSIFCNCPQTGMRAWMMKRDAFAPEEITRAYLKARNEGERKFVLIGLAKTALEEAAGVLLRQGIELIDSGNYKEAFKTLSQAQNIHSEIKYQARLSSHLDLEGYEQQIKAANAAGNRPALALLLKDAADIYAEIEESDKARSYLEASLPLLKEANNGLSVAEVYAKLAELRLDEGDYIGAVDGLQKSMEQYFVVATVNGKLSDSSTSDLVDVMAGLFLIYELQGRDKDAARIVQDAQNVLPDAYKALFIFGRGVFQLLRGQVPPTFDDQEKAIELLRSLPRTEGGEVEGGLAGISLFLSLAYSMQGDYTKAAVNLRRTKEVILKWKSTDPEAAELGDMPEIFVKIMEAVFYGTGSSEQALESRFKSGLEKMIPQLPDLPDYSQSQLPLGEIDVPYMLELTSLQYLQREKYEQARQCLLQALALAESSDDKTLPVQLHLLLALFSTSQNNDPEVLEHLNMSLRLSEKLRAPLYAAALGRLMTGASLILLASTHESAKNYPEARRNYQKVLELLGPFTLFNWALHKAIAQTYYDEGRYKDAIREVDAGIALAKRVGLRYFLWEMYQLSGRAHWANNEPALARRDLEASVAEIEAMRHTVVGGEIVLQGFFEDKLSPYHDLIEMLLEQGNCNEAFAYAERSKSRVLLDVLKRGRNYTKDFMSPKEQGDEVSLRRNLIALNRRVEEETNHESQPGRLDAARGARAEARLDYELFRANLYVAHPEMVTAPGQESVKVEGLRDLLASRDTALLEYVVTGYSTYLFVLTADDDPGTGKDPGGAPSVSPRCRAYPLEIKGEQLEDKVNEFRVRVGHPEGVLGERARELYNLLLEPAERQLAGKKTLVIVPDGILWEIPFQALQPNAGRYLLQDSVIYYAPSFTALQEMKKLRNARAAMAAGRAATSVGDSATQPPKSLTLLTVGNPLLTGPYESLQGTGELAARLEALYGKANTRLYTAATADEERIKNDAPNYQVIHLGTHGVLDDDNPMYSYVMLSLGEREGTAAAPPSPENAVLDLSDMGKDGFLEAWEIMDLELNAQLVVLSACETARGRVVDGEGMVGISWSLFIAGSPSTVVSQWKVDENSTDELMFSFHENFVRRGQPPRVAGSAAEALQKASLKLMESTEYKHPYYWAGFVLIGDGSW
jgi:CHAT domain-containing protein